MRLRHAAVGAAGWTLWRRVREGACTPNWGNPEIEAMIRNVGVGKPIPWCAAAFQAWADAAAAALGVPNPLDGVLYEDTVQSYIDWADAGGGRRPLAVDAGDAVVFDFNGDGRYDHIGIVVVPPAAIGGGEAFETIEGNTDAAGGREGVEVARKARAIVPGRTRFIRWDD